MKKFLLFFLFVLLLGLVWYLFIKKYDYEFQMEAKYGPGTVFYEISDWKHFRENSNTNDIKITDQIPFQSLTQKVSSHKDANLEFFWEFEEKNDSVTQVSLNVRSSKNRISNRWGIINPFGKSTYIDTLKQRLLSFKEKLNQKQDTYRIKIAEKPVRSPDMTCVCHSSRDIKIEAKAPQMLRTISFLEEYVLQRDLKLTGYPFVKITRWDREAGLIDFDFCFPVNLAQDIRPTSTVDFREMKSFPALMAVFNGNYRNSHLAWFDLLNRAKEVDLETNELPLEIFFQNPRIGEDSSNWRAEIYLPIVEEQAK